MMALSTLMIIPMLVLFALGQRYFIQGVTLTGLKG
jgi:multiple sugar transport system permease protein